MNQISIQDRMRGAIWGQFVGDAAALGTHWIYDLQELKKRYPEIRGFEVPHKTHYHTGKESGDFTHYGEAALEQLRSVADSQGFSAVDFGTRFIEKFAAPHYKGYLDHATKGTIENYRNFQGEHEDEQFDFQEGADDDQMSTASRLAPVIVAHWKDPLLLSIADSATRVTQNNGRAIAYMHLHAKIVQSLFQEKDLLAAFKQASKKSVHDTPIESHAKSKAEKALKSSHLSVEEGILEFGQGCPLENSFPSSIHTALKHPDSFVKAILANIQGGGDSAGRGALIGTWLGAYLGAMGIPLEWRQKLKHHKEIESLVEAVVAET